jgi:hypothetical protein
MKYSATGRTAARGRNGSRNFSNTSTKSLSTSTFRPRQLYPDVFPGDDYPLELFNFAEDAYVNAIGRRQVASTLPERFYRQSGELLLTAMHSHIDWTIFHIQGYGSHNYLKQAHGALYCRNPVLLSALGEVVAETGSFSGYRWMELVSQWYLEKQGEEASTAESGATGKSDDQSVPEAPPASGADTNRNEPSEGDPQGVANAPAGLEDESPGPGEELHQSGGSEDGLEPGKEGPASADGENCPEPGEQETNEQAVARDEGFSAIA